MVVVGITGASLSLTNNRAEDDMAVRLLIKSGWLIKIGFPLPTTVLVIVPRWLGLSITVTDPGTELNVPQNIFFPRQL